MREIDELVARGYDRVADAYEALDGEREWPRLRRLRGPLELLPPALARARPRLRNRRHPGVVDDWLGVPMLFSQFDPETSERHVREARFEIRYAEQEAQLEAEHGVTFLRVLARKPG